MSRRINIFSVLNIFILRGGEEGVQDWSADGAPAPAAAAPAAISAPASGYQVRNSLKYFPLLKYFLSPGDRGLVRPD